MYGRIKRWNQIGGQTLFYRGHRFPAPGCIIRDLIRPICPTRNISPRDAKNKGRSRWHRMHRKRFGQLDASVVLGIQQLEQCFLLCVIGTGGITNSRPNIFRGLIRPERAVRRVRIPMQSVFVCAETRLTLQLIDLPALWS